MKIEIWTFKFQVSTANFPVFKPKWDFKTKNVIYGKVYLENNRPDFCLLGIILFQNAKFFFESVQFKGSLISVFHFGSNLPKNVLNHYPDHLLFRWMVLRIVFGTFFGRLEPKRKTFWDLTTFRQNFTKFCASKLETSQSIINRKNKKWWMKLLKMSKNKL